ncbi:LysE family translocator [Psychrobacter sp. I-STPA6b]|uniref:LysE family translocator n=1 Tax=Psychrobacter sp. I-STPA6b TaxID=2585718 RepID=UPI001D0C63B0|nr:LysE family translocator [Psychrobacter sp. I-STPA6b]
MSFEQFTLFFLSTFVISATPGPNMLLAFQHGLNHGVKRTLWTLAGLSFGLFLLLLSALLGLDIISRQFPWLLTLIKVVGALYLLYLGVKSWQTDKKDTKLLNATDTTKNENTSNNINKINPKFSHTPLSLFRTGVWVSLSNPKAILFFAAFFPKFINFSSPLLPQYIWLTVGFFVSETFWQLIYTFGGKKLARWLATGQRLLWLNRICGLIFVGIALALLWEVARGMV